MLKYNPLPDLLSDRALEELKNLTFPVTFRFTDQDGNLLMEERSVCRVSLGPDAVKAINFNYDTDVTYYHNKRKPVFVSADVYFGEKHFAAIDGFPMWLGKRDSVTVYGFNSPRHMEFRRNND